MSRLTYKLDEPIKTLFLNYEYKRIPDYDIDRGNFGRITDDMIFNKLGQLEDIEEELGIELITLFNVYNNINKNKKFYSFDYDNNIIEEKFTVYASMDIENKTFIIGNDKIYILLSFKDYGKMWALTREELEEAI